MKKTILAVVTVALFASCGAGPEEQGALPGAVGAPVMASSQQALLSCLEYGPAPERATAPRELDTTFAWDQPLVRDTARSAYLIVAVSRASTTAPSRFVAVGYDVRARQTLFYVTGDTSRWLNRFMGKWNNDILVILTTNTSPTSDFAHGASGYLGTGPLPTPGPGSDDWKLANYMHAGTLQNQNITAFP